MSNKNSWSNNSWGSNCWGSNSDKNSWAGNEAWKREGWTGIRSHGGWSDNSEVWRANDGRSDGDSGSRSQGDLLDKGWGANWKDTGIVRTQESERDEYEREANVERVERERDEEHDLRSRGSEAQAAALQTGEQRVPLIRVPLYPVTSSPDQIPLYLPEPFDFRPVEGRVEVPERFILSLRYFQDFRAYAASTKIHNEALKFIRDHHEIQWPTSLGGLVQYGLNPDCRFPIKIPAVVHEDKSPVYDFNWDIITRWNWHQTVAGLDEDSMRFVVEGVLNQEERPAVADLCLAAWFQLVIGTITNGTTKVQVTMPLVKTFGISYSIATMEAASLCTPIGKQQRLRAHMGCLRQTPKSLKVAWVGQMGPAPSKNTRINSTM